MLPTTTLSDRPRSRVDFQPLVRLRALGKEALSRLAVPAAVLAAGWSLAAFTGTGGGAGASETEYLTFLATGVLTAAALMAPRPGTALGLGGTLAVLVLWVVPPGPSRGAGLTAMLLALLVLAAIRCWGPAWAPSGRAARPLAANDGPPAPGRLWTSAFATVFGFQVLMGAEGLLNPGPDPVTLGRFLLLPALAATALAVLVRVAGPVPALIAGAAAATAGGGWGAGPVLTLTALAGGAVLATPVPRDGSGGPPVWLARSVAGVALVAPLVWQQRAGAIAAAAGLALALADPAPGARPAPPDALDAPPRDPRWLRASLPLLPVVAVLVGSAAMPLHPWRQAVEGVLWLPVLLPALLFPAVLATVRGRSVLTLAAVGLALAAGRGTPEPSILAAPVALAALSLPTISRSGSRSDPRSGLRRDRPAGAATGLQGIWSLALLAATTLAVTYPWLRPEPPATAASWLGLAPFGPASGGLAGLQPAAPLLALVPLFLLASLSRWLSPRRLALGLGAALALLLVAHLPSTPRTVLHPGGRQILDVASPEIELPLDGTEIRRVVLDTHLTHAGELRSGVTVAVLRLEDRSGASIEWPIRMGEETGEWAAARPDLARRPSLVTPPPWLSQVVESPEDEWRDGETVDGERETWDDETGRRFFAYRYRTVLEVERAAGTAEDGSPRGRLREPVRLLLRRSRALPLDVTLAVFHLETRP